MPATVPTFLLGVRVALPQAVIATLVVEMFTGATGVGSLMMGAQRNFDAPAVFGLLALMGLVGFFLTAVFAALERAAARGVTPMEEAYDRLLDEEGHAMLLVAMPI